MKDRSTVEIQVAANGYVVLPVFRNSGSMTPSSEIHVFETFEGLTRWLEENLEPPKDKEPIEISKKASDAFAK